VFAAPGALALPAGVRTVFITGTETPGALWDHSGLARLRFGVPQGGIVLLRPDQHVAARFAAPDPDAIGAAHTRALGRSAASLRRAA
jgi:3-(3-hydroxy-phenyl)propionate hydroxylase